MRRRTLQLTRFSETPRCLAAPASSIVARWMWFPLLIVLLLSGGSSRGQQQPPINVTVKVVNVLATVRDKHGEIVSNLGKDDFTLEEDGRPQTISYFTRDTNLPLTLGLLVDTSGSQRGVLDKERTASQSFLDDMLGQDKDQAFVIHFDSEVELLQDLTSSREKLGNALQLLETPRPQFGQQNGNGGGGGNGPYGRGGGQRPQFGGAGTLLATTPFSWLSMR